VLTDEAYYKEGDVVELDDPSALVRAGRASYIDDETDRLPVQPERVSAPLHRLTNEELRDKAKAEGIRGYAKMKRSTLLKRLARP